MAPAGTRLRRALGLCGALLAVVAFVAAEQAAKPKLKFVLILSRHGVRSPTWDAARLDRYSAQPWPSWGVAPGELTPHGRELMKLMGGYYRDWLSDEHLIHRQGCADAPHVYIWSDTAERTVESGHALAESLLPGCGLQIHSQPDGEPDPIFSGTIAGAVREPSREGTRSNATALTAQHSAAFAALQFVLGPGVFSVLPTPPIGGVDEPSPAETDEGAESLEAGSSLSEDLLLEYADGMKGAQLGWGRLTQQNLLQALELHAVYTDLTRREPGVAHARGAILLNAMLRSLEQAVSGKQVPGAIGAASDSVLILVGHDTNQSNVSGMLDLNWSLPGYQPNDTPPGGAVIFSLWQDQVTGQLSVRTQYVAQSLDQMRDASALSISTPPVEQDVSVPGCQPDTIRRDRCSWDSFRGLLQRAIYPIAGAEKQ
jgi:4-phytase / acid phosphatase